MSRHVLSGFVLLIAIPMQVMASNGPSPGLATDVAQVFDPDNGTAVGVGQLTPVAAAAGVPLYLVIARMGAQAGSLAVSRMGITPAVGTTIINNFAPTQTNRGLASTQGSGSGSDDSLSPSNSNSGSNLKGPSGSSNGGNPNGGGGFALGSTSGQQDGPGNSSNGADTNSQALANASDYVQSVMESLSNLSIGNFSQFAGLTPKESDPVTTTAFTSGRQAAIFENTAGAASAPLGSGFLNATQQPQKVAALSQSDPTPTDRLAFNTAFLQPTPTPAPTTTPTPAPATAVAAKSSEPTKPAESKPTTPPPSGSGSSTGGVGGTGQGPSAGAGTTTQRGSSGPPPLVSMCDSGMSCSDLVVEFRKTLYARNGEECFKPKVVTSEIYTCSVKESNFNNFESCAKAVNLKCKGKIDVSLGSKPKGEVRFFNVTFLDADDALISSLTDSVLDRILSGGSANHQGPAAPTQEGAPMVDGNGSSK